MGTLSDWAWRFRRHGWGRSAIPGSTCERPRHVHVRVHDSTPPPKCSPLAVPLCPPGDDHPPATPPSLTSHECKPPHTVHSTTSLTSHECNSHTQS